jgi:hypothetical protein
MAKAAKLTYVEAASTKRSDFPSAHIIRHPSIARVMARAVTSISQPMVKVTVSNQSLPFRNSTVSKKPESQKSTSKLRPTDVIHKKSDYTVGLVFSAPFHEQDLGHVQITGSSNVTKTSVFGPVYSKYRKFVVVKKFATHVLALPLFTHDGKGLANKIHSDEFIAVRDVQDRKPDAKESSSECLWALRDPNYEKLKSGFHTFKGEVVVHFTYPACHKYSLKSTLEGHIEEKSMVKLQKLLAKHLLDNEDGVEDSD